MDTLNYEMIRKECQALSAETSYPSKMPLLSKSMPKFPPAQMSGGSSQMNVNRGLTSAT